MSFFPPTLENLIEKFASLPGIGQKSANDWLFMSSLSLIRMRRLLRKPLSTLKETSIAAASART